jgi:hypothetical protein
MVTLFLKMELDHVIGLANQNSQIEFKFFVARRSNKFLNNF